MILINEKEVILKKDKHIILNKEEFSLTENDFDIHQKDYDFIQGKKKYCPNVQGEFFLYEVVSFDNVIVKMTYPKIGMYLDSYAADQTIEVEWINRRRTWEYNTYYEHPYQDHTGASKIYNALVADQKSELNYLILWSDQMLVYGSWKSMPDWKQLRQAYERTWWFKRSKSEIRDIQLNRILNGIS